MDNKKTVEFRLRELNRNDWLRATYNSKCLDISLNDYIKEAVKWYNDKIEGANNEIN